MDRTACTEPQCLYKGALYLTSVPVQGCTLPYLSACTRVQFTLTQCLYNGALYLTFYTNRVAVMLPKSVHSNGATLSPLGIICPPESVSQVVIIQIAPKHANFYAHLKTDPVISQSNSLHVTAYQYNSYLGFNIYQY